jgi:4-amino-4-deoxy-L-arabinose transferase-like glycosyltransferase
MNMHCRWVSSGSIRVGTSLIFGMFVLSRLLSLSSFPIFNDEALYVQYSQLIRQNWAQYKFISVANAFGDWKPPLQYWIGALFVDRSSDPLLSARVASFVVSVGGFWGLYLLVRRLFDGPTALIVAVLFTLCPPVLMYNNQFIAET